MPKFDKARGFSAKFVSKSPFKQTETDPKDKSTKKTKEEMEKLISSGDEVSGDVGRSSKGIFQDPETGRYYSGSMWSFGEEVEPDTIRNSFDESIYDVEWNLKK